MDSPAIYGCSDTGLSSLKSDQDFCFGADSIFSPCFYGYPQDTINYDDQVNQFGLDFDSLDTFSDVILKDDPVYPINSPTNNLSADYKYADIKNLFPILQDDETVYNTNSPPISLSPGYTDLAGDFPMQPTLFDAFQDVGSLTPNLDEFLNPLDDDLTKSEHNQFQPLHHPEQLNDTTKLEQSVQNGSSKITIKLKKFKSNKVQKKQNYEQVDQHLESWSVAGQQVPDARTTLKDALNMDSANVILDRLFEHDSDMDLEEYASLSGSSLPSPSYSSSPSSPASFQEFPGEPTKRKGRVRSSTYDRYNKKKEQNKQAATRYRVKKRKAEDDLHRIMVEEEQKQKKLKKTLQNLKREVNFMKKLMREAFIIKGLVSADAFKKSAP